MFKFASLLGAVLFVTGVAAHGAVTSYVIDGTKYPGYAGFSPASSPPTIEWQWPDYNPTLDPADKKVMCNGGTSAGLTASVSPGSSITAEWAQWTHAQGSVAVYLYKCAGEFSSCTGGGSGWFKIDEAGLLSGTMYNGVWGLQQVIDKKTWTSKIPDGIAPGNYLIRHELIAVHQTNTPQFYAECAQLVIGGSGTKAPTSDYLVAIPGYCKLSDPNVTFDIYGEAAKTTTTWDVPGPPVWGGAGGSAPQTVAPATATAAATGSPSTSTGGGSSSSGGGSSSGGTAPLYGQCGGNGYTGPTTCASGTCKKQNDYYSQCMP